jgi:Zn-dependent protease with chaperone function
LKRRNKKKNNKERIPISYINYFEDNLQNFHKVKKIFIVTQSYVNSELIFDINSKGICHINKLICHNLSMKEISIILAHEIAHLENKDTWKRQRRSLLLFIPCGFLFIMDIFCGYFISHNIIINTLILFIQSIICLIALTTYDYYYLLGELRADKSSADIFGENEVANVFKRVLDIFSRSDEEYDAESIGVKELEFRINVLRNRKQIM